MEEEVKIPHGSAKNLNLSVIEDEKEKVKDFVYKHFREVTDMSLSVSPEEPSLKENGSSTKKDKLTLNKAHCKVQQRAVFSGKILSFVCSVCKDDSTYSPNDLLKHFQAAHQGTLPTYPCDLCGFVTNEFPALQRHRIEHRNTLVTCELCNDGVQYSLLLLTRHYIMCHSLNGQFHCDWCEFTTVDAGTFVQHIHHHNESPWKCSKCRHISLNEEDHEKHMKAHTGALPVICQICGYGAMRSEQLKKHITAVHNEESERKNSWRTVEDESLSANSCASVKHFLSNGCDSQEALKISKHNCMSGSLPNQNGRLIQPDISLEEFHHCIDGTVAKNDKYWGRESQNTGLSTPVMLQECDNTSTDASSHTSPNGLTVLMVKNKISLPPNCTTKVMGFKIVDGKKHLVLKVIPTAKQGLCSHNHSLAEDVSPSFTSSDFNKSEDFVENGESSESKSTTLHCFAVSPMSVSYKQTEDIMAVKVKNEEEEPSVCSLEFNLHRDYVRQQCNHFVSRASIPAAETSITHCSLDQSPPSQIACSKRSQFDNSIPADSVTGLPTNVSNETLISKPLCKNTDKCGVADDLTMMRKDVEKQIEKCIGNKSVNSKYNVDQSSQSTPECTDGIRAAIKHKNILQNCKKLLTQMDTPSISSTSCCLKTPLSSENCTANQEVFAFHNYSKEAFSTSPKTALNRAELSSDMENSGSSQFSLTVASSPEPLIENENGKNCFLDENQDKLTESDIEDSENISSTNDPPTEDENSESVFQDFNIIKIEEESIPVSKNQSEMKHISTSFGSFVEEHSDAIITQQLNKDKMGGSSESSDPSKQTKTTLRILQLPEGKQPVLLRTTDNHFAMPVPIKARPGFKLITNSANPQINVSYMKPGFEGSTNTPGVTLTQKSKRIEVSAPRVETVEKQVVVQTGVTATSNHFLINSPGLKGPVLLSSTAHNNPTDKIAKTQPTCYLVQRSIPFTQASSTPSLRLAGTQLPLNSRPVLAMPVTSADKPSTLQTGRQAFLLRYISQNKSSLLLSNQESKKGSQCSQTSESSGNKVLFKIVTPAGNLLTSGTPTSGSQSLFLATRPQTQCYLLSSNKTNTIVPDSVKKMITIKNTSQKVVKESCITPPHFTANVKPSESEKLILAPRPIRPPSERKRRKKTLFDELPSTAYKARRLSNKVLTEKDTSVLWKPVAKEVVRTLRLSPFNSLQHIKCPRRYQPVVVLNHPDADIPEVSNIMNVVSRYRGAVSKVSLSLKTIQALSNAQEKSLTKGASLQSNDSRPRPVQSFVRERFLLKLKLRKKSKKKYEVVQTLSDCGHEPVVFDCWFCGRLFNSQEDWIGHGQRHLMEATRDWNKLF